MEKDNLKQEQQCPIHDVKRSFWHNVKRIVGGKYYEAKTDITYWYSGKIKLWLERKSYNVKKWFLLRWYDVRIWWLKNCA
jgi:hypothetical protein